MWLLLLKHQTHVLQAVLTTYRYDTQQTRSDLHTINIIYGTKTGGLAKTSRRSNHIWVKNTNYTDLQEKT
ncbi:hypothetical protein Hanom_Chr15g01409171 [Helianthus anomalus]